MNKIINFFTNEFKKLFDGITIRYNGNTIEIRIQHKAMTYNIQYEIQSINGNCGLVYVHGTNTLYSFLKSCYKNDWSSSYKEVFEKLFKNHENLKFFVDRVMLLTEVYAAYTKEKNIVAASFAFSEDEKNQACYKMFIDILNKKIGSFQETDFPNINSDNYQLLMSTVCDYAEIKHQINDEGDNAFDSLEEFLESIMTKYNVEKVDLHQKYVFESNVHVVINNSLYKTDSCDEKYIYLSLVASQFITSVESKVRVEKEYFMKELIPLSQSSASIKKQLFDNILNSKNLIIEQLINRVAKQFTPILFSEAEIQYLMDKYLWKVRDYNLLDDNQVVLLENTFLPYSSKLYNKVLFKLNPHKIENQ